jgi:putative nucleotidyltransferase with HDIG domain
MKSIKKRVSSVDELIGRVQDLPSLPNVVMEVYRIADEPTVNAQKMSMIITRDQGFAARLLRMANSAYYGLSRQVGTVEESVVVLGVQAVKNLALLAGTYPLLQKPVSGYTQNPNGLWIHSLATALIAQAGGRLMDIPVKNEAFTAGLLHDVGKLVISTYLSGWMGDLHEMVMDKGMPVHKAEQQLFGFTHEAVGAAVVEQWNLPAKIVQMIRYHHQASESEDPACALIEFADYCANTLGYAMNPESLLEPLSPQTLSLLGLGKNDISPFQEKVEQVLQNAQSMFSLA